MEPFTFLWIAIVLIAAFFASILGVTIGGTSLLMVPLLVNMGMGAHNAIATISFAVIFLSLSGAITYMRHIKLDYKLVVPLVVFTLIGSFIGSNIVLSIDEIIVKRIIGSLMILMAIITFYKKDYKNHTPKKRSKRVLALSLFTSLLIGMYWGFVGGDSALILVLMLMIIYTMDYLQAIAITRVIGLFAAIAASAVFGYQDAISYQLAIPLAVVMAAGAIIGATFIMNRDKTSWKWLKVSSQYLRYILMVVVVVLSVRMLFF